MWLLADGKTKEVDRELGLQRARAATLFLLAPATIITLAAKTPREQILVLKLTSFAALVYAIFFASGLAAVAA